MAESPLNGSLWRANAECLGLPLNVFFGPSEGEFDPRPAKKICRRCPVRKECLEFALQMEHSTGLLGVFGGMSHRERLAYIDQQRRNR